MDNEGYLGHPGDVPTGYLGQYGDTSTVYPLPSLHRNDRMHDDGVNGHSLVNVLRSLENTLRVQSQSFLRVEGNLRQRQVASSDDDNSDPDRQNLSKITRDQKVI